LNQDQKKRKCEFFYARSLPNFFENERLMLYK